MTEKEKIKYCLDNGATESLIEQFGVEAIIASVENTIRQGTAPDVMPLLEKVIKKIDGEKVETVC